MSRELMPKSGIMMPHVVINRDAAVVGVSTIDGVAGAVDLTGKYLQKTDAADTYLTKTDGATKTFVTDAIGPIMSGALFKDDPVVANDVAFRSGGANGVESVDMIKVTPENTIKLGSYASSVQGVEIHSAGRLQVVDQNDSGIETKYPVYSKRYRPEIEDLPFAAIGSYVKDSKGRTVGVTRTGINSDIKQFTQKVTFQQPVTVADGVGDYDAVTMRQLRNSGGGSGGPTMSGISNFGIGDFHLRDSRAFIPAFEVVSDGQLLNRADYPDLWAYAQLLSPITDEDWRSSMYNRGRYSTGDGTTTFRVPDRNGIQRRGVNGFVGEDSLGALYGRGDGGASAANGQVFDSAAPAIYGNIGGVVQYGADGAFNYWQAETALATQPTTGNGVQRAAFDAARCSPIYGRSNSEIMGRNFVGVWTIRAHGGFTAANTSWSVINGDKSATPGAYVSGGQVMSKYQINGVDRAVARMSADWRVGDANQSTIHFYNNATDSGGTAITDAHYSLGGPSGQILTDVKTGLGDEGGISVGVSLNANDFTTNGIYAGAGASGVNWGDAYAALLHMSRYNNSSQRAQLQIDSAGLLRVRGATPTTWSAWSVMQAQGTSGRDFKRDITPADPKEAFDRIASQDLVTFIYKDDEQERVRFGIIAEDAEKIAPQYIKHSEETVEVGGEVITRDHPRVDVNPIVMDLIGAVHYLRDEVEQLKAELAELKAGK